MTGGVRRTGLRWSDLTGRTKQAAATRRAAARQAAGGGPVPAPAGTR
jgi:hypothetical protein